MRIRWKERGTQWLGGLSLAVFAAAATGAGHAQTTPSGQVVAPGANSPASAPRANRATPSNCTGQEPNSAAGATAEPNCIAPGPGFANPSTNRPQEDKGRNVLSLVRVEAVIPRPPVTLPDGDSFSTVGSVTLVKLHRPEVDACLATGRRISARAGAPTSTTCLDPRGQVLAYEECRANSTEAAGCAVVTGQEIAKQQETLKTP